MEKIVLGLDMDGCLYDWHGAVYTYFQYMENYDKDYDTFWLDFIRNLPQSRQDYIVSLPFLYEATSPRKSVMSFLNYCKDNDVEVYYITHRPESVERVTRRYMRNNNFPFLDNLFMTGDKGSACRYLGITHFLDDHIKHIKAVQGIAETYLMSQPWNREWQEEYRTVHGIKEFQEAVFNK